MSFELEDLKDASIEKICAYLGYEREHRTRNLAVFVAATKSWFRRFEKLGTSIPPFKTGKMVEAWTCARNFLSTDNQGEKYWPIDRGSDLSWPRDKKMLVRPLFQMLSSWLI